MTYDRLYPILLVVTGYPLSALSSVAVSYSRPMPGGIYQPVYDMYNPTPDMQYV